MIMENEETVLAMIIPRRAAPMLDETTASE